MTSLAETWVQLPPIDAVKEAPVSSWRLGWQVWPSSAASAAIVPGEAATRAALEREGTRQAMIALIRRFAAFGLSWYGEELAKITAATEQVSEAFLRALPAAKAFPKISPDGEGGLMMVWEGASEPFLLTINDLHLHGVIAPHTLHAEYIDDVPIDPAQVIPDNILDAIPNR